MNLIADTNSAGMFLLARLIMDNLMDQDCREDLKEELSDRLLPNGIEEACVTLVQMGRCNALISLDMPGF